MRCALLLAIAGCSFRAGSTGNSSGDDGPAAADALGPAADGARALDAAPDAPPIAVTFVQSAGSDSAAAQVAAMLTSAQAAGDLDVVAISWPNTALSVMSVVDSDGNSFQEVGAGISLPSHGVLAVYVAANVKAGNGPDTVTATLSGATSGTLVVAEYRGLAIATPIEGTQSSSGTTGTAADSGAYATSHPHDLVVGAMGANRTFAPGAGFTSRVDQSSTMIEDHEVMAAGSYDATATLTSDGAWFARVIALRAEN